MSVYVLRTLNSTTQVLLLRRCGGRFAGQWWPVTGTLEAGEDPPRCAVRELQEETALTPQALYRTALSVPVQGGGCLRVFVAAVASSAVVRLNWEHDRHRWCRVDEARDLLGHTAGPILTEAVHTFDSAPSTLRVETTP